MDLLLEHLFNKQLTLASAESLTCGLFASTLGSIPGISKIFKGGVVTYWTEMKEKVIGVSAKTILEHGVVSNECAQEMAKGVQRLYQSDVAISFTGNAGPDVMENKPVGLVYIGIAIKEKTFVYELHLSGNRNSIRNQCVNFGINKLIELI